MSVPMGGGRDLTYSLRRSSLPQSLRDDFYAESTPLFQTSLGLSLLAVSCSSSFWDECDAIFWGGVRRGCSACNILCRFLWGVTVPVLQRTRSWENCPTPTPTPIGDPSGMRVPRPRRLPWVEVSVYHPLIWGGGVEFIYQSICGTLPLMSRPLNREIDDELCSVLNYRSGRPPHGPLPLWHPPSGENTKAWNWITDGNRNLNKWLQSWAMRKSINSMEETTIDGGNSEERPLFLERENIALK